MEAEPQPIKLPDWGVYVYVGVPESGKTTLARRHLEEAVQRNDCPALIVDSEGAGNLSDIPRYDRMQDVLTAVFGRGEHARWIPDEKDEVESLCAAVRKVGHVNLFIDEVAYYAKAGRVPDSLEHIIRAHRHVNVNLYLTSQFITDFAPFVRSCATEFYAFRIHDPVALKYMEQYFGFDIHRLRKLHRGEFLRWNRWDAWTRQITWPPVKRKPGRPRKYPEGTVAPESLPPAGVVPDPTKEAPVP